MAGSFSGKEVQLRLLSAAENLFIEKTRRTAQHFDLRKRFLRLLLPHTVSSSVDSCEEVTEVMVPKEPRSVAPGVVMCFLQLRLKLITLSQLFLRFRRSRPLIGLSKCMLPLGARCLLEAIQSLHRLEGSPFFPDRFCVSAQPKFAELIRYFCAQFSGAK